MFTNVRQCFLLNIVYFSVCLTSNKLYWIEDQLADVSTRFYTSASWRRRVDRNSILLSFSFFFFNILNSLQRLTVIYV